MNDVNGLVFKPHFQVFFPSKLKKKLIIEYEKNLNFRSLILIAI